jgi:hypothetical protein
VIQIPLYLMYFAFAVAESGHGVPPCSKIEMLVIVGRRHQMRSNSKLLQITRLQWAVYHRRRVSALFCLRPTNMDSSSSRQQEEQRKQAEIRKQIAVLQAQLADIPNIATPAPLSPKRKQGEETCLAPATPSPSEPHYRA